MTSKFNMVYIFGTAAHVSVIVSMAMIEQTKSHWPAHKSCQYYYTFPALTEMYADKYLKSGVRSHSLGEGIEELCQVTYRRFADRSRTSNLVVPEFNK